MNIIEKEKLQEIELVESTDNALVVSAVMSYCRDMGFDEINRSMISTAASELSTNILKYAGKGTIIISSICGEERMGIEITAIDRGPGIEDLEKALSGNYSSGGTLGLGLSSVKRIMDDFTIHTDRKAGTMVCATKWVTN